MHTLLWIVFVVAVVVGGVVWFIRHKNKNNPTASNPTSGSGSGSSPRNQRPS